MNKYLTHSKYIFIHSLLQFILTHYHYKIINLTLYLHYWSKCTTQHDHFLVCSHQSQNVMDNNHAHVSQSVIDLWFALHPLHKPRTKQIFHFHIYLSARPCVYNVTTNWIDILYAQNGYGWLWWWGTSTLYIIKLITINTEINVKYIQFYFLHCTFYLVCIFC